MNLNQHEILEMERLIKTTMIGSIARVEEFFGPFWGFGKDPADRTEKQEKLYQLFLDLREDILDLGNEQIRILRKRNDSRDC